MAVKFNPISGQFDLVGGGGAAGGLPVGGVQYDLLVKNSATDYDAIWSRTIDTLTLNGLLTAPHIHGALAGPLYIHVKNTSGVTIPKGYPVYITGSVGASGQAEVAAADCSNSAKMPAIGIVDSDLIANAEGHCTIIGSIGNLNTASYSINSPVFVAPGGGLTQTRPTASTDLVQNIGRVDRVNASTGQIVVMGPGRSNDIPNLAAGTVFIGPDRRALSYTDISGLATVASTGSYTDLSNTPATSTGTFTTGIKTAIFSLTDAATITTTNCSSYNTFTVTIGGNRTLGSFTTGTNGQKIAIRVRQDGTGGRTLAFDSTYWNLGSDVSLLSIASSANVYSYVGAIYNSTSSKWDVVSIVKGY
jgi:hypothetical protein